MSTPQHPRRGALAADAYKVLVTDRAARERVHVTRWDNLHEPDREKWRAQADEWAYLIAMDARAERERRQAADRPVVYAPPMDQDSHWFRTVAAGTLSPPGMVTFVPTRDADLPPALALGPQYAIHPDGTVTRHWGTPPAPPAEMHAGPARDTRVETPHIIDGYAGHSVSYPRAVNGLPAREAECVCDEPMPLPAYNPDHPDCDHQRIVPVDAWLRCLACHGLYAH